MNVKFNFGGNTYSYDLSKNSICGIAHEAGQMQTKREKNALLFRYHYSSNPFRSEGWGAWLSYEKAAEQPDRFPKQHIDRLVESFTSTLLLSKK